MDEQPATRSLSRRGFLKAAAASVALAALSDRCPGCLTVPSAYTHTETGWECDNCGTKVVLNAAPLQIAACKQCGKSVIGDLGYCSNCGTVN